MALLDEIVGWAGGFQILRLTVKKRMRVTEWLQESHMPILASGSRRRSQRNRLQWSRFGLLTDHYILSPKNAHPYPEDRFASRTRGRSRMQ